MKMTFKRFVASLSLVIIGTIFNATASAECLSYLPGHKAGAVVAPQSWREGEFGSASLLLCPPRRPTTRLRGSGK
jgi:hypothetical protein